MIGSIGLTQWVIPLSLVIVGVMVGLTLEKLLIAKLRNLAAKTKRKGFEVLARVIRGIVTLWSTIAGTYGAVLATPMAERPFVVVHNVLLVAVIFSATITSARLAVAFVSLYASRGKAALPSATILQNFVRLLVFTIGVLIILGTLGVSITPILTAMGVAGLAAALALQDTLSNLFSGLQIVGSRQVRPGDYVKLESGDEGFVVDIGWRNTTIRAYANNMIIVPNAKLASSIITNYFQPQKEMGFGIPLGVSYDSDLAKVERVTVEVAKEVMRDVPGAATGFEPLVRFKKFGDFSIDFVAVLRVKEFVDQYLLTHEFIKKVHERYAREGIKIPYPVRTVYVKAERPEDAGEQPVRDR